MRGSFRQHTRRNLVTTNRIFRMCRRLGLCSLMVQHNMTWSNTSSSSLPTYIYLQIVCSYRHITLLFIIGSHENLILFTNMYMRSLSLIRLMQSFGLFQTSDVQRVECVLHFEHVGKIFSLFTV